MLTTRVCEENSQKKHIYFVLRNLYSKSEVEL